MVKTHRRSTLDRAEKLVRARRFSEAIKLLEINILDSDASTALPEYRQSFDFYYLLAVACMYQGDMGGANTYLQQARRIKMRDPRLLVAEGAFFLRRGDTARAVEYYLDALDAQPDNKTAKRALEFIKTNGESETITGMVETGKIKQFFPPLGMHPAYKRVIAACIFSVLIAVCGAYVFSVVLPQRTAQQNARADLSSLVLTGDETKNPVDTDMSDTVYRYILSPKDITNASAAARKYFQEFRDNAAQVEINRILNSNAKVSIRQKARLLMEYLVEPTFDSLPADSPDNFPYKTVAQDPALYLDCFVSWSGRVTNVRRTESTMECDLLVGYDTLQIVEGNVPLVFDTPLDIDVTLPVRVLGKMTMRDGKLTLKVKSIYQPLPPR